MTDEEFCIISFLQGRPDSACSRKEIARKAVRRSVYEENQNWVDIPLNSLVARGVVELHDGLYKLKKDGAV
jgi:hypothetical protein